MIVSVAGSFARLKNSPALFLGANTMLRMVGVGLRSILTIALAVWLKPADLGIYGLIAATLALTVYFFGFEFHIFASREISIAEPSEARHRIRDQFALLFIIYLVGAPALFLLLRQFGVDPKLLMLIVPLAIAQHVALELYRLLTRMGELMAATICLLIKDASWVPACFLIKAVTGNLSLTQLISCWLIGSIFSLLVGAWLLARRLPAGKKRPIDFAWLGSGLRTSLRMLAGSLAIIALFSVDRMIFAAWATPDELGAYAFFAIACASLQGIFETAILPYYWTALLEAERQGDTGGRRAAELQLARICLIAATAGGAVAICGGVIVAKLLPHPAYAENLHLLYYIAAAYALLTLANIPHYRLFASKRDSSIVSADIFAFGCFLIFALSIALYDKSIAVPLALALSCGTLFAVKSRMASRLADNGPR